MVKNRGTLKTTGLFSSVKKILRIKRNRMDVCKENRPRFVQ
jgi:hypothetical protein